jgi:hypothetical protein
MLLLLLLLFTVPFCWPLFSISASKSIIRSPIPSSHSL